MDLGYIERTLVKRNAIGGIEVGCYDILLIGDPIIVLIHQRIYVLAITIAYEDGAFITHRHGAGIFHILSEIADAEAIRKLYVWQFLFLLLSGRIVVAGRGSVQADDRNGYG